MAERLRKQIIHGQELDQGLIIVEEKEGVSIYYGSPDDAVCVFLSGGIKVQWRSAEEVKRAMNTSIIIPEA